MSTKQTPTRRIIDAVYGPVAKLVEADSPAVRNFEDAHSHMSKARMLLSVGLKAAKDPDLDDMMRRVAQPLTTAMEELDDLIALMSQR